MIPPGTVDYQLSVDWDLYMQVVRGTDSTVAFKSVTSLISIAIHVLIPPDVTRVPRFLVRMLLPLRAQNPRSYLRSAKYIIFTPREAATEYSRRPDDCLRMGHAI